MSRTYRVVFGPDVPVTRTAVRDDLAAIASMRDLEVELVEAGSIEEVRTTLGGSRDGTVLDLGSLDLDAPTATDASRIVEAATSPVLLASWRLDPPWAAIAGEAMEPWARPILGRGVGTYGWALRRLHHGVTSELIPLQYGEHPDQVGDLWLPEGDVPAPVVVLIHGGLWQEQWQRDLMDDLAADLAARGFAAWNLEHRRVGPGQPGVPHVVEDAVAGVAHLAQLATEFPIDPSRVVAVGHSAGGQLALCAAVADRLGLGRAEPPMRGVVTLAGYPDLEEAAIRRLGNHAVPEFVGGEPSEVPERYRLASPRCHLPIGVPHVAVQGLDDAPDLVDINRLFVAAARDAGDDAILDEVAETDHFAVIDPSSTSWRHTLDHLDVLLGAADTSVR